MASLLPSSWTVGGATAAAPARAVLASAAIMALLSIGVLAGLWLVAFARRFRHMARVLQPVPKPPAPTKGVLAWVHWALGPVVPLFLGTPWDVMRGWLEAAPPVVHHRIGLRHVILVGDAAGMKRIFQTKQRAYVKDIGFSFSPFMPILGTGLVTADGELWRTQRLLLGPALRTEMLDEVVGIAKEAVDRLSAKLAGIKGSGQPVDMAEEFRMLTLQVIGEAILSLPPEECDKVFPDLYLPVMTEANLRVLQPWRCYLPVLPAWWAFASRMRRLNTYIISLLRERWRARHTGAKRRKEDMLDRIFTGIEERGQKWSAELEVQLCYEIKTFLLAGHETSAAMLTWTLYQLTQQPDCLAKVVEEAVRVFGSAEQLPRREAVDAMDFTVSCLKETLRNYSVVPVVARHLTTDDQLSGYQIPAGSTIIAHLHAVHNDGWQQPDRWRPDRFMPGGEYDQFDDDLRLFRFVPFVQGPRNCLGQFFALLEGRVVLALLVKRFKFRLARQDGAEEALPRVIPTTPLHGLSVLVD